MSKKILIDTSKEDETRIALTENNLLEEYEIESSTIEVPKVMYI